MLRTLNDAFCLMQPIILAVLPDFSYLPSNKRNTVPAAVFVRLVGTFLSLMTLEQVLNLNEISYKVVVFSGSWAPIEVI